MAAGSSGTEGHVQPSDMAQSVQQFDPTMLNPTLSLSQAQRTFFLTSNQSHNTLVALNSAIGQHNLERT